MIKHIKTPFGEAAALGLRAGDRVAITGAIYTARDAAHKRLVELIERGEALPFELSDAIIYYTGPTPARPGRVIGSAGPTTSYRMDAYAPLLIERGLRGMIGKGYRGPEVMDALRARNAVYFAAIGGAAALLSSCVRTAKTVAYEDLGAEAIVRLEVENLPVVTVLDCHGGDLYASGRQRYLDSLKEL